MISLSAKIITGILGFINAKKIVEKAFNNPSRSGESLTTNIFSKSFIVSQFQVNGKSVITLQTKVCETNKHVIFFHGGAYLLEGNFLHFKLVEKIAVGANCKVSYIDYPLAPEFNYKATFEMVQEAYNQITTKFVGDQFILMGDSAGGGLALAFAQKLVKENATVLPVKNILFSPWLDISMTNPAIMNAERTDKILPLSGLIDAGKKYAGGDDVNLYLLSPINGEFKSIGDTLVFYGTDELLNSDCKKFEEKVKGSNANFKFYEYYKMQHDWVILPIPEAKQTISTAIEFIKK